MSLLELQIAFRAEVAASDDADSPSSQGMQIYRDAYRGRLLAALEVSFERTRRWVGDEAFIAAACHHVLTHPPRGWTLDDYGAQFPEVLAALFRDDAEVAELAWLEWHMQQAFAARDTTRVNPAELAARDYGAAEWEQMRFAMAPGFAIQPVSTRCTALWESLAEGSIAASSVEPARDICVAVWRAGLAPRNRLIPAREGEALALLAGGATLGRLASQTDADLLGTWLTQWLSDDLFSVVSPET